MSYKSEQAAKKARKLAEANREREVVYTIPNPADAKNFHAATAPGSPADALAKALTTAGFVPGQFSKCGHAGYAIPVGYDADGDAVICKCCVNAQVSEAFTNVAQAIAGIPELATDFKALSQRAASVTEENFDMFYEPSTFRLVRVR